jgi:hypothetical protein
LHPLQALDSEAWHGMVAIKVNEYKPKLDCLIINVVRVAEQLAQWVIVVTLLMPIASTRANSMNVKQIEEGG